MRAPLVIDIDHSSVLLGWEEVPDGLSYELQMITDQSEEWQSLSTSIKQCTIRKKNLLSTHTYYFRVRFCNQTGWSEFSPKSQGIKPFDESVHLLDPPKLTHKDTQSVTLEWTSVDNAVAYRIRYRRADEFHWTEVESDIHQPTVRKKGLSAGHGYVFAVKPIVPNDNSWQFSVSSSVFHVENIPEYIHRFFPSTLLSNGPNGFNRVNTGDRLAGKVVALYFSASWCGPCRNFTPVLSSLYTEAKKQNKNFEVVFCSGDNSNEEFAQYFHKMPWLAIDFEDETRERMMSYFKVNGIPKLCILNYNGALITDNAVSPQLTVGHVDTWVEISEKQARESKSH